MYAEDMPRELFEEAARQFGLTGAEVDTLREQAKSIDRTDLAPASGRRPPRRGAGPPGGQGGDRRARDSGRRQGEGEAKPETQAPAAEAGPPSEPEPPEDGSTPKRGHLRLVK
jgi:hypothetical protein